MINYYLITKPGIILGNLVTVAAGFLLASKGKFYPGLFVATLLGIAFIIASACVFNNYIDRKLDKKMKRTRNRPLAAGLISGERALFFGTFLGLIGVSILFYFTNVLTTTVAITGFLVYVLAYSLWKGHTIYGTAIGSIAGAVPPVVGYCAISNHFDTGALILFLMMVMWQMPHFFSIALYRLDDYTAAGIPVLPVIKGARRTKMHMTLYIMGFIVVCSMLTFFQYTGVFFLLASTLLGFGWLGLCLKGFNANNDQVWGFSMFRYSLILIAAVSFIIPFDV